MKQYVSNKPFNKMQDDQNVVVHLSEVLELMSMRVYTGMNSFNILAPEIYI
jgi:hypothetical protein